MRKILPFVLIILILTPSVASAKISLRDIGNSQINSDYEKKIIIGKISNIVEDGPNIIFTAVNIRTISFSPFTYIPYISNESITISKAFIGILKGERIFGIFLVLKDEGNDNFKIICDSEIIKIYWYRVEKIWENENMTTLKVSVLHESIVNRTVSFNETFQLYNDQDECF